MFRLTLVGLGSKDRRDEHNAEESAVSKMIIVPIQKYSMNSGGRIWRLLTLQTVGRPCLTTP